jgi:hypothetical protein
VNALNPWAVALLTYLAAAVLSFIPVAVLLLKRAQLHPGGPSFEDSPSFSPAARTLLTQHWERIQGTLGFWKTQAAKYKAFHSYSLVWITISTVAVPFLAQSITSDPWSKWLVTVVGAHAALLLALSRAFRVERNYRTYRHGESEFYDAYRRLLDRPPSFGRTEDARLKNYFEQVELVRRFTRTAETDNFPSVEEVVQPDSVTPAGRPGDVTNPAATDP